MPYAPYTEKKDVTFIYGLKNPVTDEFFYIGKSNNPTMRFNKHSMDKSVNKKSNYWKHLIRKGINPIMEIIDEVPKEKWAESERGYIALVKSFGANLRNMDNGGIGSQGHKVSDKTREILRIKSTGRKKTESELKKLQETRRRNSKSVLQYDLQGNFIREWECVFDWGGEKKSTLIKECCEGVDRKGMKKHKAFGFIWRYKTENYPLKITPTNKWAFRSKVVYCYDRYGFYVKEYISMTHAAKDLGLTHSNISTATKRGYFSVYYFRLTKSDFIDIKYNKHDRPILIFNIGDIAKKFDTQKEAAEYFNSDSCLFTKINELPKMFKGKIVMKPLDNSIFKQKNN